MPLLGLRAAVYIPFEELSINIAVDGWTYTTPVDVEVESGVHVFEAPFSFEYAGKTLWFRHWEDEATKQMLAYTPRAEIEVTAQRNVWALYMPDVNCEVKSAVDHVETTMELTVNDQPVTTPYLTELSWGLPFTVKAPPTITVNGVTYQFKNWVDELSGLVVGTLPTLVLAMDRYFILWANYEVAEFVVPWWIPAAIVGAILVIGGVIIYYRSQ